MQEYFGLLELVVETDRAYLGGAESTLYEELLIGCERYHIDILVLQLAHYAVDAAAFHAHAGADRVDAVVIALHGYLGAFARHAGYGAPGQDYSPGH